MAEVSIENVTKYYGQVETLKGLTANIDDGEFVILVGPSGCGKSTLLRSIAGLERIHGGEIRIGGTAVHNLPAKARDIAMVFQNYALYPHMNVAQNMSFALRLAGANRADIESKVKNAAQTLGLEELLDRYPRQLSGGQRQRVAMGRAIVRNPSVFLFDEPLSNLDAKLRVQMRSEVKSLHRRLGTTMIYVTHDQVEAMTMADRIVVLRAGTVEQMGTPLELYDRPATQFVAGFIGSPSMNFIEGELAGDRFKTADGIHFPFEAGPSKFEGSPVTYGVRPEHLQLSDAGVEATVETIEPTGSETYVTMKVGRQQITATLRERKALSYGEKVFLKPNVENVHLFDDLGNRLSY